MATKISTKEAVKEINSLINEFKELQASIKGTGTVSAANFRKVETGLAGLKTVANQTNTAFKNLSKSQKNYVTQTRNLKVKVDQLTASNKKLQASLKKTKTGFSGMLGSVNKLIGAFGIVAGLQIFGNILKDAFELTKTFDSLNFTMEKVTGSTRDMANASVFLKGLTRDFGVELVATTNRYLKFLAASRNSGISLKDTEQIFKSMTKASSVLGLKTDELSGVYLALEQMMSKGKITTEELRRQLGERLPGAMGIMASAIGVSVDKLDEMMKKGEVFSSEVLPKFAKAVESAYGIESVKKVNTLVAAQNRLSNSWQTFIQTFTEGDTVLKEFIGGTLTNLANAMNWFTDAISTEEQKLVTNRIEARKIVETAHEKSLKSMLGHDEDYSKKSLDLDKQVVSKRLEISEAGSQEERNVLNKDLELLMKEKADLIKSYDEKSVKISLGIVDSLEEEMKATTAIFDKYKNHQDNAHKSTKEYREELRKLMVEGGFDNFNDFMDDLSEKTALITEKFEFHKKNIQKSNVLIPDDEDSSGGSARKDKSFKAIYDKQNQLVAQNLQGIIDSNKRIIESDETTFATRKKLIDENTKYETVINGLLLTDKKTKLEETARIEIQRLQDIIDNEKETVVTKERAAEQILKIEKQLSQDIELVELGSAKAIREIKDKQHDDVLKYADNELTRFKKEAKAKEEHFKLQRDMQIKALRDAGKTEEQIKESMEDYDRDVFEKQRNELIELAETWIALGDANDIATIALKKYVNEQKAKSQANKDKKSTLEDDLRTAQDFANAIVDVGNAVFDKRIENINAEIVAEEEKYDRLIAAAHLNKDEQNRLEEEKAAKIAELEAKRLKEQQKQARLNKAQAIFDIGINTAVAISKVLGQTGIFGLAAWIPVAALGALQTAAVLASPIPQYADGLENADKDHIGMINDATKGGKMVQEYVERDGQILTTSTKNAIVGLKKGDTVHKDYDSLLNSKTNLIDIVKATTLANLQSNVQNRDITVVLDEQLGNMKKDIKNGIKQGFNNVSLVSKTNIDASWLLFKNDTL